MSIDQHMCVEGASRLAVTAAAADLEFWARGVAVQGRVDLDDLVGFVAALREASLPQQLTLAGRSAHAVNRRSGG